MKVTFSYTNRTQVSKNTAPKRFYKHKQQKEKYSRCGYKKQWRDTHVKVTPVELTAGKQESIFCTWMQTRLIWGAEVKVLWSEMMTTKQWFLLFKRWKKETARSESLLDLHAAKHQHLQASAHEGKRCQMLLSSTWLISDRSSFWCYSHITVRTRASEPPQLSHARPCLGLSRSKTMLPTHISLWILDKRPGTIWVRWNVWKSGGVPECTGAFNAACLNYGTSV